MEAKRHHYLPQRYLSGFADPDGRIWVFDRHTGKLRRDTPLNTGVESRLYAFVDPAGAPQSLEPFFAYLESRTWPTIDRLDREHDMSSADRAVLAFYTAFQLTRTPQFLRRIEASASTLLGGFVEEATDQEAVENLLEAMSMSGMDSLPSRDSLFSLIPMIREGRAVPSWGRTRFATHIALRLSELLAKARTDLFYAEDGLAFITTDSPVLIVPLPGQPPTLGPGSLKFVPLTQRTLLIYAFEGDEFTMRRSDADGVTFLNSTLASTAERLIIGSSEALVRSMSEVPGDGQFCRD